ncbi:hypothetical protein NQ315_002989 [Exocentrus adspersus]|uniref:C2H2-type domain-containing protein n=1 Tax=Exocentrus adspersus TaxID=1586481 RepID=A0AAV8W4D1_9CUCU|nr:hypothetical protein NQ315_002989 [Exocentrus adspersus]
MEKPSKVSIIGAKNDLNSATSTCSSTTETTNKEAAVVLNEIEKANQQQNPVTNDSTKPSQDNVPKKGNEYLKQMFVTTNYFIENRASSSSAPFGSKADSDTLVLPTGSAANEEMSEDGFTNLQLEKIVRPRVYFLLKASVGDPHTPNRRPRQLSEWTLSEAQFNELIEPRWPMKHILGPIVLKAEDTIKIDCFYKCAKCSYQTSVYNTLKSHIQNHITTDLLKRIFRCTLCSFMSFQLSELEQHMRCAHDKPMKRKHSLGHRKWGSGDCSFCTFGKHV